MPYPRWCLRPKTYLTVIRIIINVSLFTLVYLTVFGYPPVRIGDSLGLNVSSNPLVLGLIFDLPVVGWLSYRVWKNGLTRNVLRAVYAWLGVSFIALMALIPWEVLVWVSGIPQPLSGALALGVVGVLVAWGITNANRFRIKRFSLSSPKLTAPLRLVHVSDVHIGSRRPQFLHSVVQIINHQKPDVVAITGDLIDFEGIQAEDLSALADLAAPSYFCIGNHERYVDCDAICERLRALGVNVLRNESIASNAIGFVGIDDADDKRQVGKQLASIEWAKDTFSVLLYHRPDDFESAAKHGFDLMLAGHTHNGQIAPFNYLVKTQFPQIAGLYEEGDSRLYVSTGTGTWGPPLRLGSVNEIAVFDLAPTTASGLPKESQS